jgi:c-di-GMP-binding flagellar brake protein YcgR
MKMEDHDRACYKAREFLRIPTAIPVEVVCLGKDGHISEDLWTKAEMWEIGGGGAKIVAPVDLTVNDSICLRFAIPDTDENLKIYGRVVGVMDRDRSGQEFKYTRIACVKFVGFSEADRGKVLTYAFREQIRRAREKMRSESVLRPEGDQDESVD